MKGTTTIVRGTDRSILVERKCLNCSGPFYTAKSQIRQGKGKFCSRKCINTSKTWKRVSPQHYIINHSQPVPECGCWICDGNKQRNGYGRLWYNTKHHAAHRLSWQAFNEKPIPAGMVIMHTCDTPMCINPDHLQLGTPAENAADRERKGRGNPRGLKTKAA